MSHRTILIGDSLYYGFEPDGFELPDNLWLKSSSFWSRAKYCVNDRRDRLMKWISGSASVHFRSTDAYCWKTDLKDWLAQDLGERVVLCPEYYERVVERNPMSLDFIKNQNSPESKALIRELFPIKHPSHLNVKFKCGDKYHTVNVEVIPGEVYEKRTLPDARYCTSNIDEWVLLPEWAVTPTGEQLWSHFQIVKSTS